MSNSSLVTTSQINLRWILQRDLPAMLQIEQRPPAPQWTRQEFRDVFQSADTAGWVAEVAGKVVGFLVYRVTSQPDLLHAVAHREKELLWHSASANVARKPLGITVLSLAVAAPWRRRGIGRALIERLSQKLQYPRDSVRVTVPESNLAMQLLLRSVGYRARAVHRDYFGAEDGYLMERHIA